MSTEKEDMQLDCMEAACGKFTWTKGEQEFYEKMQFTPPKRCALHRAEAKQRRDAKDAAGKTPRESDADMLSSK